MCSTAWLRRPDARHVLVLSIFLDILSVSLVVPSLPRKYRALGLTGFKFGLVGSVYSATQIMGGVILGIASDRMLGRRGLLLVSFAGAAISYTLVAYAQSLTTLVASRVIVGLCKQSMTAVTALMTEMTGTGPARTAWLSRISCASTLAWAAGGAMGGYLSTISPQLPELVSVGLYALNALMVVCALPPSGPCAVALRRQADAEEVEVTRTISSTRLGERVDKTPPTPSSPPDAGAGAAVPAPPPVERLQSSFRHVLRHRAVLLVVTAQLTRLLVGRALGSLADMYELERWSLTTAEIGYMRSYKSVVVLVLQMLLLPRLTRRFSLHVLLHAFTWVKVGADLLEMLPATAISPFVPDALRAWLPGRLAEDPTLMVFAMLCIPVRARAPARARSPCGQCGRHACARGARSARTLTAAPRARCVPRIAHVRAGALGVQQRHRHLAKVALHAERAAVRDGRGARDAGRAAVVRRRGRADGGRCAAQRLHAGAPAGGRGGEQRAPRVPATALLPAVVVELLRPRARARAEPESRVR